MKISSRFNHHTVPPRLNNSPSMTHQSFKAECDVNTIMDRYNRTGCFGDPSIVPTRSPMFGDFTEVPDYRQAQEVIIYAQEMFDSLPAKIRSEFDNDPGYFMEYYTDPANHDYLVELGLIKAVSDPENDGNPRRAPEQPDSGVQDSDIIDKNS